MAMNEAPESNRPTAGAVTNVDERVVVPAPSSRHHIVIVGGGAGGLELATRLGDTLGRRARAEITLVDRSGAHLWKPLLHEIAAGSMDLAEHELGYLAQAHWHHFRYAPGEMIGLDRARREIIIGRVVDEEGSEVAAERRLAYDTLVIAVGSQVNDFGTPGVKEHALALDTPGQAARFNRRLINACIRAHSQPGPLLPGQLQVAIIGAGATGVELAAELRHTTRALVAYGLDRIDPVKDIGLHLIEAADRILPALPLRLSKAADRLLTGQGVQIHTSAPVAEVLPGAVRLRDGAVLPAELIVWAAGVKAPVFLADLDGLESNRINQLAVLPTLQTTRDADIFAIGDCAACAWIDAKGTSEKGNVPPRAQAAHQQASHLLRTLTGRLRGEAPQPWHYRDFGSLVSLGRHSTVGNLMGRLVGGGMMIEGWFARFMYVSLYKMHELALHGWGKVMLDTLARRIGKRTDPPVKLH
jgi:NADH:ubiquinone reductase (H+-translocating)